MFTQIDKGSLKILGMTTLAFFLSFLVWFNMTPFTGVLKDTFQLTKQEVGVLLVANVALTIPARVVIGMLVDRFGPRKVYSTLLIIMSFPCFMFAFADSYGQLLTARLLLGMIGAGFVIGIRMIAEWFPDQHIGISEGIYGGWGNFGSAAAAMTLPLVAVIFGGDDGWRLASAVTGVLAVIYGMIYYRSVTDTPQGTPFKRPQRNGAMEVTSYRGLLALMAILLPMYVVLGILTWQLHVKHDFISGMTATLIYFTLAAVYLFNCYKSYQVNRKGLRDGYDDNETYSFKQVAVLCFAYFVTFGSELAVVSMLPQFFGETFGLGLVSAGMIAGSFAFTNLVARPFGGLISDRFGRKKTLVVLMIGLTVGYLTMAQMSSSWPLFLAIAVTMLCSFFVQAGAGAVFAMVPLVKKSITGQVAGLVGAYGSVGATAFLTVFSFLNPAHFFLIIGFAGVVSTVMMTFLKEPMPSRQLQSEKEKNRRKKVVASNADAPSI
jgi:NNP family nitrate/nitrite transporter-like MFS transporter